MPFQAAAVAAVASVGIANDLGLRTGAAVKASRSIVERPASRDGLVPSPGRHGRRRQWRIRRWWGRGRLWGAEVRSVIAVGGGAGQPRVRIEPALHLLDLRVLHVDDAAD
eukprot:scaffold56534_cov60-Phaeocystis_antarctica.AAC.1